MSEKTTIKYTTVKISKPTLRLLVQFKALLERVRGTSLSFDYAILTATIFADWQLATELKITKKNFNEYADETIVNIVSKDERMEIYSLLEEFEAFGLLKSKNKNK